MAYQCFGCQHGAFSTTHLCKAAEPNPGSEKKSVATGTEKTEFTPPRQVYGAKLLTLVSLPRMFGTMREYVEFRTTLRSAGPAHEQELVAVPFQNSGIGPRFALEQFRATTLLHVIVRYE